MTKVAIHQPNFYPWLGYFHKLLSCDVFILLDDVQLPRGKSFVNRVAVKSPVGAAWLTVPLNKKGGIKIIKEATISNELDWKNKHLNKLFACYAGAPYYEEYLTLVKRMYSQEAFYLVDLNINIICSLGKLLGSNANLIRSSDLKVSFSDPSERLIKLIKSVDGTMYISGAGMGSQRYLEKELFLNNGIEIIIQDYVHPEYPQMWGSFISNLSVLDLLFNCGADVGRKKISAQLEFHELSEDVYEKN